eukprot:2108516-Amphidinium_carterae.2
MEESGLKQRLLLDATRLNTWPKFKREGRTVRARAKGKSDKTCQYCEDRTLPSRLLVEEQRQGKDGKGNDNKGKGEGTKGTMEEKGKLAATSVLDWDTWQSSVRHD